ncbi:MAG: hypothetical protein GY801_26530 [bacterium]|nr:hypothetical protein [bacterium]
MRKRHDHYPIRHRLPEKAIDAATENDFLQYKALANKLLGTWYLSLNKKRVAGLYLMDVYYDDHVWGATEVLKFLTERYAPYLDLEALQRQSGEKLSQAMEALWGEMELAKKIQTSLLPDAVEDLHPDFDLAATMLPADEVDGDYYDIALDQAGALWLGIGVVTGHGVMPGLIMMMAQTIQTAITTHYAVASTTCRILARPEEHFGSADFSAPYDACMISHPDASVLAYCISQPHPGQVCQ